MFGLVAPTGVDLARVLDSLKSELKAVNYKVQFIRLSELIPQYLLRKQLKFSSEYERIKTLMELGTTLREKTGQLDVVARLGIAQIQFSRRQVTGDDYVPANRTAYVISSFKRPEEVALFREIYGKAFTLISVYSPRTSRIQELTKQLKPSIPDRQRAPELAVQLIDRDHEEEGRPLGQRLGRTFPLADYFLTLGSKSELDAQLSRLVKLTFGHPYISPSRDEQGMFFAQAAAVRSLDLSRQVGAAVVDGDGSVLSLGCNDVPKFGGGLYWEETPQKRRDFELGRDANVSIKAEILEDTFSRLKKAGWLSARLDRIANRSLVDSALFKEDAFLKNSLMFDIIEFGRAVHAEAAAIADAARRGVSLANGRLFCTTFPCHICARHIVASGIKEVLFIEPYEKSRTEELYGDSVSVEPHEPSERRVNMRAFVGVAPRRYMDFFQQSGTRKKADGRILEMDQIADAPKIKRSVLTYVAMEDITIRDTLPVRERKPSKRQSLSSSSRTKRRPS